MKTSVCILKATSNKAQVSNVPRSGQRGLWRGVRLSGSRDREDVRLQEDGEEEDQEASRRGHGA